jgi:hypothetical protein
MYALPNKRSPVIPIPKVNYCDMGRYAKSIPFLRTFYRLIGTYDKGHSLTQCPLAEGFYQLKNIFIDDQAFGNYTMVKKNRRLLIQILFQDENGKKPIFVYKYRITLLIG